MEKNNRTHKPANISTKTDYNLYFNQQREQQHHQPSPSSAFFNFPSPVAAGLQHPQLPIPQSQPPLPPLPLLQSPSYSQPPPYSHPPQPQAQTQPYSLQQPLPRQRLQHQNQQHHLNVTAAQIAQFVQGSSVSASISTTTTTTTTPRPQVGVTSRSWTSTNVPISPNNYNHYHHHRPQNQYQEHLQYRYITTTSQTQQHQLQHRHQRQQQPYVPINFPADPSRHGLGVGVCVGSTSTPPLLLPSPSTLYPPSIFPSRHVQPAISSSSRSEPEFFFPAPIPDEAGYAARVAGKKKGRSSPPPRRGSLKKEKKPPPPPPPVKSLEEREAVLSKLYQEANAQIAKAAAVHVGGSGGGGSTSGGNRRTVVSATVTSPVKRSLRLKTNAQPTNNNNTMASSQNLTTLHRVPRSPAPSSSSSISVSGSGSGARNFDGDSTSSQSGNKRIDKKPIVLIDSPSKKMKMMSSSADSSKSMSPLSLGSGKNVNSSSSSLAVKRVVVVRHDRKEGKNSIEDEVRDRDGNDSKFDEDDFKVRKLLDKKVDRRGQVFYKVLWEPVDGSTECERSWEPGENLRGSSELVNEFEKSWGMKELDRFLRFSVNKTTIPRRTPNRAAA